MIRYLEKKESQESEPRKFHNLFHSLRSIVQAICEAAEQNPG